MADLAGITLAVFDKIWVIGSKAAEVIADYRHFDKDSTNLADDIKDENNKTQTLKCLLFEPSQVYNGKSLFQQFDKEVQIQLHVHLGKLFNIINESSDLLQGQQIETNPTDYEQAVGGHEEKSLDSLAPMPNPPIVRKKSRTLRLRWSLWDKRRLESIIKNFSIENKKLVEQVQLMCHATSVGVKITNLDRLKTDEHSKKLGFDVPAQLQLSVTGMETSAVSLQIKDQRLFRSLTDCRSVGNTFIVLEHLGKPSLVEFRSYAPDKSESVPLEGRTRERVERLAYLLRQRKDLVFHTLSCQGWMLDAQENQVAFVFTIPDGTEGVPTSLLELYGAHSARPSLGDRLRLARNLTRSICELQLVKWVHESFRSENIVFFPQRQRPGCSLKPEERLQISQPWVMGFEFSRPEFDFSSGRPDKDPARNVYRHPARQGKPDKPFAKIHDIYALGVVLLEIGLWAPVLSLEKDGFKRVNDPLTIQKFLIRKAEKSLPFQVGEQYKDLVVRCLTGRFEVEGDNKEDLKLQQAFRAHVLEVLERAAESIG